MPETLTESFCERCGTRYEFKAPTRLNPLRKTRGLFGGLKNYLTSQDALSDAIGDAMRSEEGSLASAQLEAFHETFNFCISCRQYTCLNCWNDGEGRCRSCAPIAGTDDLAERLAASLAGAPVAEPPPIPAAEADFRLDAWPTTDLPVNATNGDASVAWPAADTGAPYEREPIAAEAEPEPMVAETEPEPAPPVAPVEPEPVPTVAEMEPEPVPTVVRTGWEQEPAFSPEPEPAWEAEAAVAAVEPEPVVAEAAADEAPVARPPLRVVSWDEDTTYDLVPPISEEPVVAEVETEPEPVVAAVEPEPAVAAVEPEPEPEPPRQRIAPISETILRLPPRQVPAPPPVEPPDERIAALEDTPEMAARRAQLDLLGLGDAGEGPVRPERPAVLPYRSRGAGVGPSPQVAGGSFWEASAREVAGAIGQVGVQSCGQCGLSLSANARFCRRCGTRQQQSA